jgi:hypothetical protein
MDQRDDVVNMVRLGPRRRFLEDGDDCGMVHIGQPTRRCSQLLHSACLCPCAPICWSLLKIMGRTVAHSLPVCLAPFGVALLHLPVVLWTCPEKVESTN